MSTYRYTFADLKSVAQHAIGKDTPDARTSLARIVNDAVQRLGNDHSWSWMRRPLSLDVVADQPYVTLPEDFVGFYSLRTADGTSRIEPTTIDHVQSLRASTSAISDAFYYAVGWAAQVSATDAPLARLEIWPTPSTDAEAFFVGVYACSIPALSDDTAVPGIPSHLHSLLAQLVRAKAQGDEEDTDGVAMNAYREQLAAAKQKDGGTQINLGTMRGALGRQYVTVDPSITLR